MPAPTAARLVHVETVMGTTVSFDLRGAGDHRAALDESVAWFHEVDRRFSPYRPGSEVSRFHATAPEERSAELAAVVAACTEVESASAGAFRADRATGYDPSGYVKGWSVDRAAAILKAHGCDDWSVNAGGDVRTARPRDRAPWRVGVRHPVVTALLAAVVPAWDLAVATSGAYERGDHVVDPRTGRAAAGAVAVTVCGPELGRADALATAAFVLGEEGPAWVAGIPVYECWAVLPGGRVRSTAGFPRFVRGVPVTARAGEPGPAA
ncbi:FAD:protein FMN transferase [Amnibacterium endophyticum]|uniref:FAD:protein FMN transferase n=1 Tax=Amnibacterium endophyticum TaxID=2109337 RepID=A0ABW4LCE0_9MICO